MKFFEVEVLIKNNAMLSNSNAQKKTKKLVNIMFSWLQHIAGTSIPVLKNNNQVTNHFNSIWIRNFMRHLK